MKPSDRTPTNGLTGRADLLRLLAMAPRPYLVLDDNGEHQFGYRQRLTPDEPKDGDSGDLFLLPGNRAPRTGGFKLPLQMPFVHVIAERQTREPLNPPEKAGQTAPVYEPISEDDAKALEAKRQVNYQYLAPKARLLPALKLYLAGNRRVGLDISLLVKQIAGQQLPRHLPRRQVKSWHPQWVVVLDFAKRLWPFRQDMHQLAEHLLHACGRSGVSIRIINHGPLQHWTDWVEEQRRSGALPVKHAWRMPPADTPILLVSDLGLLEGADSASHQAWQDFIRQLGKAQCRLLALLPLGAEQLDAGLPNSLTLLRWSPDARIHPEHTLGKGQAVPDGLDDLLAMVAVTRRVDPPLLRALRLINPKAPLNAGLEGAFWRHADVEAGSSANIRHDAQAKHLAHFSKQLKDCHGELEQLRSRHHAHLRAVLNHEETLLWGAHAWLDGAEVAADTKNRLQKADAFMRQLAATLKQPDGLKKGGVWWSVAQDIVQRADNRMGDQYMNLLAPLVQAIAEVRGDLQQAPDWIDPAFMATGETDQERICWVVRDLQTAGITLQPEPPTALQNLVGEPLTINVGGLRVDSAGLRRWLPMPDKAYRLCGIQDEVRIKLTSDRETMMLATVKRPRGAISWGCDKAGVWLRTPAFCEKDWCWQESDLRIIHTRHEEQQYRLSPVPFKDLIRKLELRTEPELESGQILHDDQKYAAVDFDLDDYGVMAKLAFMTEHGSMELSFRWIEPGSFRMGSPDNEPERLEREGPRHEVAISQGFWLADTACTQVLWQAIMNNNPSRFNDDPRQPVEQVSWHDVQEFLQRLQSLLPGCQVDLPTEAEWEYACRAGTDTPFSFGRQITSRQANHDGNQAYADGEKSEYRGKTIAVKSLPANAWGLYEMHGNVWEWCKDGMRDYDEQPQVDPLGPVAGEPRAVRGGSWHDYARRARSAFRIAFLPGYAYDLLGFRFCLRSIKPS